MNSIGSIARFCTVTTSAEVKRGDVVTVSGPLSIDKDFGAGYAYSAIVEKASIKK